MVEAERPRFHQPTRRATPSPGPESPESPEGSPSPSQSGLGEPADPEPSGATPPGRSTTGSTPPDPAKLATAMGEAIVGLLVALVGLGHWVAKWRRRELREPTEDEYDAVARPLGRIVARHVRIELAPRLVLSIVDGARAAGAANAYLLTGPIRPAIRTDTSKEE